MKREWYSGAIFGLLAVMAGLLVWLALGGQVPRWTFAAVIALQGALRVARDWRDERARNRSVVNLLISFVLAYLILTAV